MALDKTLKHDHEVTQGSLRETDEAEEQAQGANPQLAYLQQAQKEARDAKAREVEEARAELARTEEKIAELEQQYEALEEPEPGERPKAPATEEVAEKAALDRDSLRGRLEKEDALDLLAEVEGGAKGDAKEQAEADQARENEAKEREAREQEEARRAAEREAVQQELQRQYDVQQAQVEHLIQLLQELARLELDLRQRRKIKQEIEDQLQAKLDEIDQKKQAMA